MREEKPWLKYYGDVPATLEYPPLSVYGAVAAAAKTSPDATALEFMGRRISFAELDRRIVSVSRAFAARGMRPGDRVVMCVPNIPQTVIAFYALNRLGAVPAMIHPLSAPSEITSYGRQVSATWAMALDAFFPRFAEARGTGLFARAIACRLDDYLGPAAAAAFWLAKGRKIPPLGAGADILRWKELETTGGSAPELAAPDPSAPGDLALILFSGGSSGASKAIMLSNRNVNALAAQTNAAGGPIGPGDSMLSILPTFHGFGLAVGIHSMLANRGTCILVPRFDPAGISKLVKRHAPRYLAGVPTLFDSLAADPEFRKARLSCFRSFFVGGDSLSLRTKERFEAVVRAAGGSATLREGYGLTESVTANMLMPRDHYRERSMGIPYPDTLAKIVRPGTSTGLEPGEEGEICVSGPTVMMGYLDDPAETAAALKVHPDGRTWLHTGDFGRMDSDGFFYFIQRMKRIIKSSGVSVYPSQVEIVLDSHPSVRLSCVVGVPHPSKVEVAKGFVALNPGYESGPELERELLEHCKAHLSPFSCPRSIEFRDELPLTKVGKVAYRMLEEEARAASGREPA